MAGRKAKELNDQVPATAMSASSPSPAVLTLDYAHWAGPQATEATRKEFASQLRQVAVTGIGFFLLAGTPFEEDGRRERQFELSRRFFALPIDVRRSISMDNSPHFRGFAQFGDERTQGVQDLRDQLECGQDRAPFPLGHLSDAQLAAQPYLNLLGPNVFLDELTLPGHRAATTEWLSIAREVNLQLTRALEVALGTPANSLVDILADGPEHRKAADQAEADFAASKDSNARYEGPAPYARMKMIRYPRGGEVVDGIQKADAGSSQGVGSHKDGGWITLLATDSVGGLQVQDFSGRWVDVQPAPGALAVNFGQQLEKLTHGAIQAATHRVVIAAPQDGEVPADRYSVAWFSMPSLTSVVNPLPLASLSPDLLEVWRNSGRPDAPGEAEESQARGRIVSDVPSGDLHGGEGEEFGLLAWRGITRSHPTVVNRWHSKLVPRQES